MFSPAGGRPEELERFAPALVNLHVAGHLPPRTAAWVERARRAGARLVVSFQDLDHPDMRPPSRAQSRRLSRLASSADGLTALTPALARALRRRFGARARAIGNGIAPEFFAAPRRRREGIVAVARLSPYKGVDLLLWAFARLLERRPEARLTVYGPDFQAGHYQGLARKLALGSRARFAGAASARTVRRALSGARLFVSASRRETWGNALLEAMACGTPALATRTGAAGSVIAHGRSGWLVPAGDLDALSRALARLWEDGPLLARLGREGRRAAGAHLWAARAADYESAYREALRAR